MNHLIIPVFLLLLLVFGACQRKKQPDDPTVWKKVKIDLKNIDEDGLYGPKNGKVAINYEFCIPADAIHLNKVKKIDPSLQKTEGKGRINCQAGQWLMIGSTHQKNHKKILYDLAKLDFVSEIQQTFWE